MNTTGIFHGSHKMALCNPAHPRAHTHTNGMLVQEIMGTASEGKAKHRDRVKDLRDHKSLPIHVGFPLMLLLLLRLPQAIPTTHLAPLALSSSSSFSSCPSSSFPRISQPLCLLHLHCCTFMRTDQAMPAHTLTAAALLSRSPTSANKTRKNKNNLSSCSIASYRAKLTRSRAKDSFLSKALRLATQIHSATLLRTPPRRSSTCVDISPLGNTARSPNCFEMCTRARAFAKKIVVAFVLHILLAT
jgi:hypothetical protein